jgi:hypothetical protein
MTEAEIKLVSALALMVEQYPGTDNGLDSLCMSAGERALEALAERGLVTIEDGGRCGRWTAAGIALLNR